VPDPFDDWGETVSSIPGEPEIDESPSQAYLVVVRGNNVGESFPVVGSTFVIGRGSGSDLRLNDEGVSRFHCKLYNEGGAITVEDLNSRNGTYCNGERIATGRRSLMEGDRLQVGTSYVFRFTYVETTSGVPKVTAEELGDTAAGVLGRRRFMEELAQQVAQAPAVRQQLSLVLVHVDRSDELAAAGDLEAIVTAIATQLRGFARTNDLIARIGSGDLVLLGKRASPGDTFMLAERLRKQVHAESSGTRTLSIGIAAMHEISVETAHDFMVGAGSALHRARSQGGNRTVLCTPDLMRDPKNRIKV